MDWAAGAWLGFASQTTGSSIADVLISSVVLDMAVPEPSSWVLLAFGFGGLAVASRRVRRRGVV